MRAIYNGYLSCALVTMSAKFSLRRSFAERGSLNRGETDANFFAIILKGAPADPKTAKTDRPTKANFEIEHNLSPTIE